MINTDQLRSYLEEKKMSEADIDEIMERLLKSEEVTPAINYQLQIETLRKQMEMATDWREKSRLAAKILSIELDI